MRLNFLVGTAEQKDFLDFVARNFFGGGVGINKLARLPKDCRAQEHPQKKNKKAAGFHKTH
jgi:hypothetical protein